MSAIDEILSKVPISQLASQVGASEDDTKTAVTHAVTSLLGGMSANAADGGADALAAAAQAHATKNTGNALDLSQVDTEDGAKIVKHVLGDEPNAVASAVAAHTGSNNAELLAKVMPVLAPVVMTYLGSKMSGGSAGKTAVASGLGGLIGNLFQGGAAKQAVASPAGGITDLLGGLLGGNKVGSGNSAGAAGGLGGILSSIF